MRQIWSAFLLLLNITLVGTVGYVFIEKWTFLESLYMTVITITTIGFGEIRPLTPVGRVFTIGLIISGVGTFAYIGGRAAQLIFVPQLLRRRRVNKKVQETENHYVVCGFGRLGKPICEELAASNLPFVVVEKDAGKIDRLIELGCLCVHGDATQDEVLLKAGVKRAKGLAVVLASDAENVFTTLSVKVLNPDLFVVARAIEEETETKLKRAGADRIVKPYEIGAARMANLLLRPGVADFIDLVASDKGIDLNFEEIVVGSHSALHEKTIAEAKLLQSLNIMLVGIFRENGVFSYNPPSTMEIKKGDRLIAIGQSEALTSLNALCGRN